MIKVIWWLVVHSFGLIALGQNISEIWFPIDEQHKYVHKNGDGNFFFWFKNLSEDTVRVSHVSATGGNTCPMYDRDPVAPGEWDVIRIKYATTRIGRVSTTHHVYFQDIAMRYDLYLKGFVYPEGGSIPTHLKPNPQLYFSKPLRDTVKQGEFLSYEIELFNPDVVDHHLIAIEAPNKYWLNDDLQVMEKLPLVIPKNGSVRIPVKVPTEGPNWNYNAYLSFRTDENREQPFISIHLPGVATNENYAEITFDTLLYEKVFSYGEYVDLSYPFTNTGNVPLIIANVKYSGGAGLRYYPKEPIMPGKSGIIRVTYNTRRQGPFRRTFTITSNARNTLAIVRLYGEVLPK